MKQVEWTARARKDLARLDSRARQRIINAVERYARTGDGDVKILQGRKEGLRRLRVGEWRVIFSLEERILILVLRVLPRGGAYS